MKKSLFLILLAMLVFGCSSVFIKVNPLTANPPEVIKGGKTTLSWNFESNADLHVYITTSVDNKVLFDNLPKQGSVDVVVNETTTFIIYGVDKADNPRVKGNYTCTVKVKQ
jgi:PBP1b-binding outer membrane lipoprotein LpoB